MEISLLVLKEHITLFVYKVLVSVSLTGLYPLTSLPPYPKECLSTLQAFISCKRKGTNTTLNVYCGLTLSYCNLHLEIS